MARKPTYVNANSLALPDEALKYVHLYRKSKKLLNISATQMEFKQQEIPAVYECEGRYFMFRNFLWYFVYPHETFEKTKIEVDLFNRPKNIQSEIDQYILHTLHLFPSPGDSPKLYVNMMSDILPRLSRNQNRLNKKSFKYSRRSLAKLSNISENVIRANMKDHAGRIDE